MKRRICLITDLLTEKKTELRVDVMLAGHSRQIKRNGLMHVADTHKTVNVSLAQQKAAQADA